MNLNLLIESIVRQTTVLIAQLATSGGGRTQLAGTANQVFLDLVAELKRQGLGTRVIADMFGLALRTYHDKVKRLEESRSARGRSLWDAVLEQVEDKGPLLRTEVLHRFRFDDEANVKGVLKDLVDSGLLYRTGRGNSTTYRVADPVEVRAASAEEQAERVAHFVWVSVCRHEPVTREELMSVLPIDAESLDAALERLEKSGRVRATGPTRERFEAATSVIAQDDATGWEAAMFDHYQAMVTALCTKLALDADAPERQWTGGSTFRMEVWEGHPMQDEVVGFLEKLRIQGCELRERLAEYNRTHAVDADSSMRVITYLGQSVLMNQQEHSDDD